jgi:hypothetical protein
MITNEQFEELKIQMEALLRRMNSLEGALDGEYYLQLSDIDDRVSALEEGQPCCGCQ